MWSVSRCWSPATRRVALRAAYTCAGTGAPSCSRPCRARRRHRGRVLRCPYHSWTYGLDGALLRAPHADLDEADRPAFALDRSGSTVGGLRVRDLAPRGHARRTLGADDHALANYATGRAAPARLTYEVAANWKVLVENYNECYHCGPVHPELSQLVPAFRRAAGPTSTGTAASRTGRARGRSPPPDHDALSVPGLDDDERPPQGWPGLPQPALSASADHVAAFTLVPRGRPHTIECLLLVPPLRDPDPGFDPSDAVDLWDLVNQQDWASARACSGACRRAPTRTAGSRRWRTTRPTSDGGCCRGWAARPMPERVDYVVVGLGALGSATAHRGPARVLGARAGAVRLGHHRGASHDTSRILRHSYHTPEYVRLTRRRTTTGRGCRPGQCETGDAVDSTSSRRTRRSRWPTTPRR